MVFTGKQYLKKWKEIGILLGNDERIMKEYQTG